MINFIITPFGNVTVIYGGVKNGGRNYHYSVKEKNIELLRLGKNIARLRERIGISQDNLALEAEVGRRTISRLEVGETDPRYTTLVKISVVLGVEVKDLMNFTEK